VRSPEPLRLVVRLPIVDLQPRVVLIPSPRSLSVTLTVLRAPEEGQRVVCAQQGEGSADSLSWSPARSLGSTTYECQVEAQRAEALELGLGLESDG